MTNQEYKEYSITVTDTDLYARLVGLKISKYENWDSLLDRLAGLAEMITLCLDDEKEKKSK